MSMLCTLFVPHTVLQPLTPTEPPYSYPVTLSFTGFTLQPGALVSAVLVPPAEATSQLTRLPTPVPQANDSVTFEFSGQPGQNTVSFSMLLRFDPNYPLLDTDTVVVGFDFTFPGTFTGPSAEVSFFPSIVALSFPSSPSINVSTNESPSVNTTGSVSSNFLVTNYPEGTSSSWTTMGIDRREPIKAGYAFVQALSVTSISQPAPTASSGTTQVTITITPN
jgi:hypothetical protein